MTERWLVAQFFYSPLDATRADDPIGDAIIRSVVAPVQAALQADPACRWVHFMRFAAGGYHVRLSIAGAADWLTESVAPDLRRRFADYTATWPAAWRQPMQLAPLAQVLNKKWSDGQSDLAQPGSLLIGLMPPNHDLADFEDADAYTAFHDLQTACSAHTLRLLELDPSPGRRQQFVRLLMDDLLRLLDHNDAECYYFLQRLQQTWLNYFELGQGLVTAHAASYRRRCSAYQRFFDDKQAGGSSLAFLSADLQEVYRAWLATFERLGPAILRRADQGRLTMYDANRLIGLFHLTHNRLGVWLLDEIYTAYLLSQHYGGRLDPAERAAIDSRLPGDVAGALVQKPPRPLVARSSVARPAAAPATPLRPVAAVRGGQRA